MKLTSRWKTGLAALIAAGTVIGAAAVSDVASALPAGTPPFQPGGGVTLTTGTNTVPFTTPFNFTFNPAAQACPGDNTTNWVYSTYITSGDPATLTFGTAGNPVQVAPARTAPLRDAGGTILGGFFPSQPPTLGAIIAFNDVSMAQSFAGTSAVNSLTAGVYNVGVACYNANTVTVGANTLAVREVARYWNTQITVTGSIGAFNNGTSYVNGVAPAAPLLGVPSGTGTSATIPFTQAAANPAVTGYTATVTPSTLVTIAPLTAASTSIGLSGLTIGTSYTVTLSSTNGTFTSPLANGTFTASNPTPPAPVASATSKAGKGLVTWTAPTSGPTPIGYSVVITGTNPVVAGQTIPLGNVLTTDVTLAVGDYSATVTATYAASEFITPVASNVVIFKSLPAALIEQQITATRPELGALILTQRCGVNGLLLEEPPTTLFPRFLSELAASTYQVGTFPTGDTQANFNQYPVPSTAVYPTRCALALTNVQLITEAGNPLRGQYFTASGALNQVTVADFRNTDLGWTLTGQMGNFSAGAGKSFSGDYLGWTPATPIVSPTFGGYTQTVNPGGPVAPGTGVTGFAAGPGLFTGLTLAFAPVGNAAGTTGGTGIADLNARVKLLIPTTADSGDYSGILTFTVL